MLSHGQIWSAIDILAQRRGLTSSGLARKAGLDPTTFNRSKRVALDGRLRWPSTESIAKILDATGASLDEFLNILTRRSPSTAGRRLPLIALGDAGTEGLFDNQGLPAGSRWDETMFPGLDDEASFGIEVGGDRFAPIYRRGDVLICSAKEPVRRGDRIVTRHADGRVFVADLRRRTARNLELALLDPEETEVTLRESELTWIARVMWVSQ